MALRDIKRKARRDIHHGMNVAVFYIPSDGSAPVPLDVRVHTKQEAITLDGGNSTVAGNLGSRRDVAPKILFWRDQLAEMRLALSRTGVISVEPGEAYSLDNSEPPDGQTITWYCTPLSEREATGLPVRHPPHG